jgi:hypothetical protein
MQKQTNNAKTTPNTKQVRAVTFWLRDLELECYGVIFASNGFTTLQSLTQLSDVMIEKYVKPNDRHKMQTGRGMCVCDLNS